MLSAIIILSSTTIPKTRINPESEIRLIVSPVNPSPATVPSNVTGKLIATQNAVLRDKNIPKTISTNVKPI